MRVGPTLLLVVPVLLAGCATGPDVPPQSTTSPATPTPAAVVTPAPPAWASCVESGSWVVDNARQADLFAEGLRSAATGVTAARTGEATWVFADGVLTRTFSAWQLDYAALLDMGGTAAQVTETSTLNGSTTAAYEVTGTDVVTQVADVSALTVDVVATKDGAPFVLDDPGSSAREVEQQAVSWGVTCDGDTLSLAARSEDGTLAQTFGTVLLHRR